MKKFFFFFLCFVIIVLTCVSALLYAKSVKAANAIPEPRVPCSDVAVDGKNPWENPEFNSLRPYQASPCRQAPYASMCGNTLKILLEEVKTSYCGEQWCDYGKGPSSIDVIVDLSGVELPILGNTEQTANSQNATDQFGDAQKVNDYVSWYLAGASQKAEYGPDTADKLVNFSGPSKKLNPGVIQELIRFKSLRNAGVKPDFTDPDTGITTQESDNHNQIVVCTESNLDIKLPFGLAITIPWIGLEKPKPCYEGGGKKATGEYRLLHWWNSKAAGVNDSFVPIPGWNPYTSRWGYHVPPFPWQFTKEIYYTKAYQEWRGKECLLLPVVDKLACTDIQIPGTKIGIHTNKWADLYQYIPLSNTTDRKGKEDFSHVPINAPEATFVGRPELGTIINGVPKLYYPHTTETVEALTDLNATFVPKEGVTAKENLPDTENNVGTCKILDVRTNPGDDLTFDNTADKHQINFQANYEVDKIECKKTGERPVRDPITGFIIGYEDVYSCSSDIYATVDLTTLAPELKNVWDLSVAGAGSTFRRIFPKVEEGAPVECIADIPGVSKANYSLNGASDGSVRLLKVLNPGTSPATEPEIYFPHLGSVYEYFLKGIQTALRPKGFGDEIPQGSTCTSAGGAADCGFSIAAALAAINKASAKYNVDASVLKAIFEIESAPYIADPSSYKCEENAATAAGPAQITKGAYDFVTCGSEKSDNDLAMCTEGKGKGSVLSRCNIDDAFELMARVLLWKAGKLANCQSTGSITSDISSFYVPACYYYGSLSPDSLTAQYGQGIPASERRPDGDMNYCDIVCHKMGKCPPYPPR